jgi:hypothetical protein
MWSQNEPQGRVLNSFIAAQMSVMTVDSIRVSVVPIYKAKKDIGTIFQK